MTLAAWNAIAFVSWTGYFLLAGLITGRIKFGKWKDGPKDEY